MSEIPSLDIEMPEFLAQGRPHEGMTYEAFVAGWEERIGRPMKGLDKTERKYLFYAKYNLDRARRLTEGYEMADFLRRAAESIDEPQLWMVLTEDWCVDSAYALPVFSATAVLNPLINMRILSRDENLDIMDRYLTEGARSIPKVVAFSGDGAERFHWGPRPAALREARTGWLAEGIAGPAFSQKTVAWYENGGWTEVEIELAKAIEHHAKEY